MVTLDTYVLGASVPSDASAGSCSEQKIVRAYSDDEVPSLCFDQIRNAELFEIDSHLAGGESGDEETRNSNNELLKSVGSIVSQEVPSLLQSHFHDKDARGLQRAEIENFRAQGRAMEAHAATKRQTLQNHIYALEKHYKETCRCRGVSESDIGRFYAVYNTFTETDWATFFSPNSSDYFASAPPLFSHPEFLGISSFRSWVQKEYPGCYESFIVNTNPNDPIIKNAQQRIKSCFSLQEHITGEQKRLRGKRSLCEDGAFYPHWGSDIGNPDLTIDPYQPRRPSSQELKKELRKLDRSYGKYHVRKFDKKLIGVCINSPEADKDRILQKKHQIIRDFRMWRFPEFRQFMRHWNGYEKFIKNINFRGRELLEAEKYMPAGFSLREYIRQEKIRLLSSRERAEWIERYTPQPVEPATDSPPSTAPPKTRSLTNAEIAAPQAHQRHILDQREAYFFEKMAHSYKRALTQNTALSDEQRTRLEDRTELLTASEMSRQAIRTALNHEHALITNQIAAWRKQVVLGNRGALLGATDQLLSLAQRYNQEGLVVESLNATDACWSILDAAEQVGVTLFTKDTGELFNYMAEQYVKIPRPLRAFFGDPIAGAMLLTGNAQSESANAIELGIFRGIVRGIIEFRDDKIDAISHPIETLKETVIALSRLCAKLDHYVLQDRILKTARDNLILQEQLLQTGGSNSERGSRSAAQELTDALCQREQWGTLWDRCQDVYAYVTEKHVQQLPPEQRAEEITALITKQLLNVGTTYAIGAGVSQAGNALGQTVIASGEAASLTPALAVAADGVVAAEGAASAEAIADALGRAGVALGNAVKVGGPTTSLLARNSKAPRGSRYAIIRPDFGADELPPWILENRVPQDADTILKNPKLKGSKEFERTNHFYENARIYKKGKYYYYRDQLHRGWAAHLEVFETRGGAHVGKANVLTGEIDTSWARPNRKLKL